MAALDAIPEGRVRPTIEQILQCPMCLDRFENPKLLPCGHTFCLACLECRSRTHHITCPLDNRKHPLPANGVKGFSSNITADALTEVVFSSANKVNRTVLKYCCSDCGELCSELKRCFNHCSAMICQHCQDEHINDSTNHIKTVLKEMREKLQTLGDNCEKWEAQHRVLYMSYENAQSELDRVFKVCFEKLCEKRVERQHALEEMVTPHLDAFKTKICKAKDCKSKAEQMCADMEARLRKTDQIREVELLCIRLKCLQQLALLEDYVMADQEEEPCAGIETVKIELDENWMNFCIGKLFRKSIVSRLGS
ncbi:RING finger protein nhl-1-like [Lineus longissimus]|uniref:RING finger protein nhl-1-like n=1 Tax=Lineus longissimus TaxID=88925 RepID=UPI00315D2F18